MTPGAYDLKLYRGDTHGWTFKLWKDAGKTQPLDLTGVTVKAEVRDKPGGAQITPLACTLGAPGEVIVAVAPAVSAALPASGVWDMQLTYPNTDVHTAVAGKVTVTADVTDSTAQAAHERLRTA